MQVSANVLAEVVLNSMLLTDAVDGMFSEHSSDRFATDYFPGESYTIQGWRKVGDLYRLVP